MFEYRDIYYFFAVLVPKYYHLSLSWYLELERCYQIAIAVAVFAVVHFYLYVLVWLPIEDKYTAYKNRLSARREAQGLSPVVGAHEIEEEVRRNVNLWYRKHFSWLCFYRK